MVASEAYPVYGLASSVVLAGLQLWYPVIRWPYTVAAPKSMARWRAGLERESRRRAHGAAVRAALRRDHGGLLRPPAGALERVRRRRFIER